MWCLHWPAELQPHEDLQSYLMLVSFHSSNSLSACPKALWDLTSYLGWPVFADRANASAATFAWLLQESTIVFLFFNEALRSVYIVINKVITAAMAFCLSHLENWMQNLFNSPIMVSWSVKIFIMIAVIQGPSFTGRQGRSVGLGRIWLSIQLLFNSQWPNLLYWRVPPGVSLLKDDLDASESTVCKLVFEGFASAGRRHRNLLGRHNSRVLCPGEEKESYQRNSLPEG